MVTPTMIKTEATDMGTAVIEWMASKFSWCSGYSPTGFRKGLDLIINKKADDNRVHRLHPILLFDIEAKNHNKIYIEQSWNEQKTACG